MSTAHPRVSIGIPVYNGERYLPIALDAVLAQTFPDFAVIISDNASTDGTADICRQYADRDPRIIYHREPVNRGAAFNFNRVFEWSQAPYCKWAAVDDLIAPDFLTACVNVLDKEPTIVCCHTRTRKIDEHGQPIPGAPDPTDGGSSSSLAHRIHSRRRPDASSPIVHRRFGDVLLSSGWSARSFGLIRREQLAQTALVQPYYGYEKVIMAALALRGRFHDIQETLFFQREHHQASSQLITAAQQRQFVTAQAGKRAGVRVPLLRGYLEALRRAPISGWQRARCRGWLVRYLLQVHKWPAVLDAALLGRGVARKPKGPLGSTTSAPSAFAISHHRAIVHQER